MTKLLDDGKPKEDGNEKVFNLVLIDINETSNSLKTKCVKKNMYDSDFKYIAISCRKNQMEEQFIEASDYTTHIISSYSRALINLCLFIINESDLKDIPYLWIDAMSVDQQNKEGKKEAILKMNQTYEKASYILAIPDLHMEYLLTNTANREIIELIYKLEIQFIVILIIQLLILHNILIISIHPLLKT
ncbi:unnamed protein product [Cunninghamella blakesleeana]